ncbi:ATP-binding protein [Paenibacillus sp. TAB 01]|uniref:ATP-binding protein n=1 Tax=Paenibacillus sp. TAB 01 TaxID=3368988 RepID=UPI0037515595
MAGAFPKPTRPACFCRLRKSRTRVISAQSHGLGLPLCRQLMELQGGSIRIDSGEGRGTEVQLLFSMKPLRV